MRIAVTGANGLVGRAVLNALLARGHQVRALVRFPDAALASLPIETIATGPIESIADWRSHLSGIDKVVHLAARTHVPDTELGSPERIHAINVTATLNLARSAARKKIPHFVYLSSVKVHGDNTVGTHVFKSGDPFNPQDLYARSKVEAEQGLQVLSKETGLNVTVLRPPLVYGPQARGNFRSLCRLVSRSYVLPFGSVHNKRALIGADHLGKAMAHVVGCQPAGYQAYLVSDGEDLSTPALIRAIASGAGKPCALLPAPLWLLQGAAKIMGREKTMRLLLDSLRIDSSLFARDFNFEPNGQAPITIAAAARHICQ